jgi:thiol-disulfide isomerase/thioredoxin
MAIVTLSAFAGSPLQSKAKVVALVFVSSECPISNKLAPELERLHQKYSKQGAEVWIIYPNASDGEKEIAKHRKEFRLTTPYARDVHHELVKKVGATITPEAAVFDGKRQLVYRGRVTDQFLALGKGRPQPTQHDLADAIEATLAGEMPKQPRTEAVGCFIQDQK